MNLEDLEKLPPLYSADAEKAVIEAMLFNPDLSRSGLTELKQEDFWTPGNRVIFGAIGEMLDAGNIVDPLTLCQWLDDRKKLEIVGGHPYLGQLTASLVNELTFSSHVKTVRDKKILRKYQQDALELIKHCHDSGHDVKGVIEKARVLGGGLERVSDEKDFLSTRSFLELLAMRFDDSDNLFADRVIAEGQPITFLGPGGVGKSRMVLQLAVSMILGRPFLGMPTMARDMRWLFIQTENSNRRLNQDLLKIWRGLGVTRTEEQAVEDCLVIHTLEKDDDALLNLDSPEEFQKIQRLIDKVDPHIVVFDPLNTFTGGDLNSDRDMRQVVNLISQAVKRGNPKRIPFVLHHSLTGKAGAARAVGWDKASYNRNSKVLQAWTRAQINLAPRDADDNSLLIMSCGKNNNGMLFPEVGVRFDQEAGLYRVDDTFDPEAFRSSVGLETKKTGTILISSTEVAALFEGTISRPALVKLVMSEFGVAQRKAYYAVEEAEKRRFIVRRKGSSNKGSEYMKPSPLKVYHETEPV